MAATNYTPIQLYFSTTASAVPLAANLAQGELAINITDGKLYYEDNAGVVQVIATKGAGTIGGSTTQIQYNNAGALAGSSAMTFNSGTSVTTLTTLNLTNALGATYGGTAQSAYAQGDVLYASATNTLSKLGIGTVNYILTSTGSVPQWSAPSSIIVQTATNLAGGAGGSVPYQSAVDTTTFLAIGAANRVMTSSGTVPQWVTALTGLTGVSSSSITNTSLTSGRVVVSSTAGLQADDADLTFDGTTLSAGGYSTVGLSTLVKTVKIGDSNFNGVAVFAAATPAKLYIGTGTVTDTTSAIGATNAVGAISSLAITPIAATNTTVTYTNAATLYIAGAPSAGTNVTLTNPYALYVAAGNSFLAGNLLFTDNTYDIGASGANRPRNLFVSSNATISGGTTLGTNTSNTLVVNALVNSNLLFTDNTYDIGASGATRPRNLYLSNNAVVGGNETITGYLAVGGSPTSTNGINVTSTNLTGVYQVGIQSAPVGTSAATAGVFALYAYSSTAAASFISGQVVGLYVENAARGAGSTITNQYGVYVAEQSRGDSNYGVFSGVSAATNKWNFYASGTANNYFAGSLGIGTTTTSLGSINLVGSAALGISSATTGDYLSSGGGNNSTYNGIAILSNSRSINTQANTSLPSWIVDIGGRAADGSTYNPNTANKFRVAYVAAGGSYYGAADLLVVDAVGNLSIGTTSVFNSGANRVNISLNGAVDSIFNFGIGGVNSAYIRSASGVLELNAIGSSFLQFTTNGSEAARITSVGKLAIGNTAGPQGRVSIWGSPASSIELTIDTTATYGEIQTFSSSPLYLNRQGNDVISNSGGGSFLVGTASSGGAGGLSVIPLGGGAGTSAIQIFNKTNTASDSAILFRVAGTTVSGISYTSTVVTYGTVSDYRLKTVIGAVADAGSRIDVLEPIEYTWNSNGQRTRGFLAHKFQEVYANSVTGTKDAVDADGNPEYQAMQAGSAEVIADLVAEIQSIRARLKAANI